MSMPVTRTPASVVGDPRLLALVMQNLVSNAWKFTAGCSPARITVGMRESEEGRVHFLADNGAGFDMRYADKLFVSFQRLHGAQFPGTGIGLAIVARVIARHGGRVWAQSTVGGGATFSFTLAPAPATGSDEAP
jgi:signal transduction histidine kinase